MNEIMAALTAVGFEDPADAHDTTWQFPVVVVQFTDTGEHEAVPQAHLSDISWCHRGREREIVAEFSDADELCEYIEANA